MSTSPEWTITASDVSGLGTLLIGCHIIMTKTAYELTKPNISDVLAISLGTTLPVTFPSFNYKGYDWVVTLVTATIGGSINVRWVIASSESEAASSAHT